jgi:REP element-mobilizing transposase RayT
MSYTKIFIHYVWATKNRTPALVLPYRHLLFDHIRQNALLKDIYLDRINGYSEHLHCLVWLKPTQTLDKVAQLLKGESAYWFNNLSGFNQPKLQWQDNYFAVSISLSQIERVRAYIDNQEVHHRRKSFAAEYDELMKQYLFTKDIYNSLDRYKLNTGH